MKRFHWIPGGLLFVSLFCALTVAACTSASGTGAAPAPTASSAASPSPAPAAEPVSQRYHYGPRSKANMQYTKSDYALLTSLHLENYGDMSVSEFNGRVFDLSNEDAYHKTEDALTRLLWTLPEEDPLSDFFQTAVRHTWDVCELRHYNACKREKHPSMDGHATYEKYGDVFGDQVLLAGGYADFWYCYEISDEAHLTVAEREAFFQRIEDGMQSFLSGQSEEALKNSESMEKTLCLELDRLIATLSTDKIKALDGDVSYYWEKMW